MGTHVLKTCANQITINLFAITVRTLSYDDVSFGLNKWDAAFYCGYSTTKYLNVKFFRKVGLRDNYSAMSSLSLCRKSENIFTVTKVMMAKPNASFLFGHGVGLVKEIPTSLLKHTRLKWNVSLCFAILRYFQLVKTFSLLFTQRQARHSSCSLKKLSVSRILDGIIVKKFDLWSDPEFECSNPVVSLSCNDSGQLVHTLYLFLFILLYYHSWWRKNFTCTFFTEQYNLVSD